MEKGNSCCRISVVSGARVGPPPSRRQYHKANTITFVSQSSPPDRSNCNGDSRCVGNRRTSKITETISASVVIPLIMNPRRRLSDCFPTRWLTTVGTSKTTINVGNNQIGPTTTLRGGRGKYRRWREPRLSSVRVALVDQCTLAFCFLRISEIRDLINTCAYHRSLGELRQLAFSEPVKVLSPSSFSNKIESCFDRAFEKRWRINQ